jgi:hypothetical protein
VGLSTTDRSAVYQDLGIPPELADPMAAGFTADMGACILTLYRAAAQPALSQGAEMVFAILDRLGSDAPASLVIDPALDPYVGSDLVPPVVDRLGAEAVGLPDAGHWWMASPSAVATAADALLMFWRTHGTV